MNLTPLPTTKGVYEELDGDGKAVVKKLKEWAADFVVCRSPVEQTQKYKICTP